MALTNVLVDELRDMYSAENQLVKALPKLAKGAKNPQLKALFAAHLEETKEQVLRLKKVFEILEEKPTGEHCNGMEGVIEEGADALEKDEQGASFDSGIVGAALRTEHYEIAGYIAAIAMADTLGLKDISALLTKNLNEEKQAAEKVLAAAKPILQESANQPEEEDKKPKTGKEKYSAQRSREDERRLLPLSSRTVLPSNWDDGRSCAHTFSGGINTIAQLARSGAPTWIDSRIEANHAHAGGESYISTAILTALLSRGGTEPHVVYVRNNLGNRWSGTSAEDLLA